MDKPAGDPLQIIRGRIDRIDAEMHRLLIERSGVIAELIAAKGASAPGAVFRPEREADMMRRLVERHAGALPLVTVEHIWREIITTFTAMQAPFGIAVGPAADALAMRDVVRFYFGFSIPLAACGSAAEAIARVGSSGREIAVIAANSPGRWWDEMAGAGAPKVFAKLPFIELPSRPADLSAYVIGPPLKDRSPPDIRLLALPAAEGLDAAVLSYGGRIAGGDGEETLLELPVAATLEDVGHAMAAPPARARALGGFAQPIRFVADRIR